MFLQLVDVFPFVLAAIAKGFDEFLQDAGDGLLVGSGIA